MFIKKTLLAAALLSIGAVGVASAASNPATTTFKVKLTVQKACSVTATDLDFGSQDATATNFSAASNGTVTVTCSKTTPYVVGLAPSNGNAAGAGAMAGQTSGNTDTVAYQLYSNSGLTTVWGNSGASNGVSGTGTGSAATALPVYGKVASANVTPDSYLDTVTVNVTY